MQQLLASKGFKYGFINLGAIVLLAIALGISPVHYYLGEF